MSTPLVLKLEFHKEVSLEMIEAIEQAIKPFGYRLHDFANELIPPVPPIPSTQGSTVECGWSVQFIQLEEDK